MSMVMQSSIRNLFKKKKLGMFMVAAKAAVFSSPILNVLLHSG